MEIQCLLDDFNDIQASMEKKHWLRELGMTIYALHVPMKNKQEQSCTLAETNPLLRKENMNLIKKTIMLADRLCEVVNPIVVIHAGGLIQESETSGGVQIKKESFQNDLMELRKFIQERYPKIILAVENNPKVTEENKKELVFRYGYEDDIAQWVKELRDPNIGTVLDTCHAIGVINYNKQHYPRSEFVSIESYLDAYASTLKLIHLSNGINFVSKREEQGLPFLATNPEDITFVKGLFNFLNEIKYNHPITIETEEADYDKALNFVETRKTIVESFRR
ncbi:TIM barrel protein (plasmid) [Aneurinibacillus sp. Ricciae_BoGa-3]|uniref:sugar phosphate isomerase/epimerase family protein n=1 Tax=Aneurinibacillus sp. Ricciae_BoGa-3 TaxID=3022697 RepID=UPI002340BF9E|nr:TIM barrel protein [Aneurinibacillus sp. Ricciae_BoGa-3]WCK57775.1 TIM barrel protein [Aneurinibacillus sp. Ricciae_BoGa-3]